MNSMEARTRVEGLLSQRDEIFSKTAQIVSKVIASNKNGKIDTKDIDVILKDFTGDEKYLIMIEVVNIFARNNKLRSDDDDKDTSSKHSNNIFSARGYR